MKRWFNPCRRHRRDICLLAGGLLTESEQRAIQSHLATCDDCRQYLKQIQSVAAPLAGWEENLEIIQPSPAARHRWTRAIQPVGRPDAAHNSKGNRGPVDWWQEVISPYRRVWAGLATVWVLMLAVHVSLQSDHSPIRLAKSPASSQQMTMAFKDRQEILAELLADHSLPREADRPRLFSPKPRSERTCILSQYEELGKAGDMILRGAGSVSPSPRPAQSAERDGERAGVRCVV